MKGIDFQLPDRTQLENIILSKPINEFIESLLSRSIKYSICIVPELHHTLLYFNSYITDQIYIKIPPVNPKKL